jgi:hypothetical protein
MAIRLEKAFGGTANAWLQMQSNYDLARARRHEDQLKVQRNAPELARSARARPSTEGLFRKRTGSLLIRVSQIPASTRIDYLEPLGATRLMGR